MTPGPAQNVLAGRGPVDRRRFLALLGVAGAGAVVGLRALADDGPSPSSAPSVPPGYEPAWPDGVIAGDPLPSGTVIWTRLAPEATAAAVPVTWEVGTDDTFTTIVAGGNATADAAADYTVKVPVSGLPADTVLAYRFLVGDSAGPVGRLRTAPGEGATPGRLRFGWASCQQQNSSLYVSQQRAAADDLDFFMHLGDYVYVSDDDDLTLADYRNRYHSFKANPLLQELQAAVPLVPMWDDGEFYNGVDRTGPPDRLDAAKQAWFEAMPVIAPPEDDEQSYRRFSWGDLADVFMIDVRSYRDPAVDETDTRTRAGGRMLAEGRTTLGAAQRAWLLDGLAGSTATWKIIGSSYNLSMLRILDFDEPWPRPAGVRPGEGLYVENEAWDDYHAERQEVLAFVRDNGIDNVVFVSGHTHTWFASHLTPDLDDPDAPVVAFDFTTGSQTADPDLVRDEPDPRAAAADWTDLALQLTNGSDHLTYANLINFGYSTMQVEACAVTVEFKAFDVYDPEAEAVTLARFRVADGADAMETEIFDIPCLSCPDPTEVIASPFTSTGLSPLGPDGCPRGGEETG